VTLDLVRCAPRGRAVVAVCGCLILAAWYIHVAGTRQVFDLQALESRFLLAGQYAARALPPNAVVLSVQESGSVRYHGGRSTLMWDAIAPDALDRTIALLEAAGRPPFIVLEGAEEPRFRARFVGQRFGVLDWPPLAEIRAPVRVRIYDPAQRSRFFAGERWVTGR
jgi:hypothetical protein